MTVRRWATTAAVAAWGVLGVVYYLDVISPLTLPEHAWSLTLTTAVLVTTGRMLLPCRDLIRAVYAKGRIDERQMHLPEQRERAGVGLPVR